MTAPAIAPVAPRFHVRRLCARVGGLLAAWAHLLSPEAATAATHAVDFGGASFTFRPSSLTVEVGDTVVFSNAGGSHTVTGTGSEAYCGNAGVPTTCSVTFTAAGSYPYICLPHSGFGMTGVVNVVPVSLPPATPAVLTNLTVLAAGGFRFTVVGSANRTNTVQSSVDLSSTNNWITVTSVVPGEATFSFTETNAAAGPIRFYRVVNP